VTWASAPVAIIIAPMKLAAELRILISCEPPCVGADSRPKALRLLAARVNSE
jgi:hypothetical protein